LIWDNVENIAGFPEGSPGLLQDQETADLNEFVSEITNTGATSVLLISRRSQEHWLTAEHHIESWAGLSINDSIQLAGHIIEKIDIDRNRITADIPELLKLVEGHPLALQLALPLLKEVPLSVLITELKRTIEELPENASEEGRDVHFTGVMEYAWTKMSHRNRTHLPFLSLFQRRVMMDILNHITQEQAYKLAMGEQLGWGACRTLLRTAQTSGFLDPVSPSVYQIHPSLPWFYGRKLSSQLQTQNIRNMEQEFVRVYSDTADYFMESLYENQDSGVTAILAEEGNLTQALGLALESQQWDNAQLLVQPLAQVYHMQKRFAELRRLRHQILEVVGETSEEAISKNATELWLYLLGTEASEAVDLHDIDYAEDLNNKLLEYLEAQPDGDSDPRTASVYHQFGQVALQRWQLDSAVEWFEKSLTIVEDSEDPSAASDDYFSLAQVKQHQRYYTEAKELYQKALDIHQRLPDEESMVNDYRALGTICQLKFEYEEAGNWLNRARTIVEEQRDEETAILIFHQMGTVAHAQYFFDDAISWYQQALQLSDRLGNEYQMAVEFHHLGLLHQTRGIVYDEAEEWYLSALAQWEKIGDKRSAGDECRQLGVLFHEQSKYEDANKWYREACVIFEEVGDVPRLARTYGQLGMIAESEGNLTDALEWTARTYQLTANHNLSVLVQVKSHLSRLRNAYGHDSFRSWWLEFTGEEAPEDLDVDTSRII
jgi:tetratricopeptide (TPR) repeat protein